MHRGLIALLALLPAIAAAASGERNVDHWLNREVVPYVREQLSEHPRFKGETVMFVVLQDNAPAAVSNALALSLRDRLLDAALHVPGLAIGWQQGSDAAALASQPVDCTRDDVHYYIGIELTQRRDGEYDARARALDLEDRSWVSGFGRDWRGKLTSTQRRALRQTQTDATFLGARDVPFGADQSDLLAAYLAHRIACALLRESAGDYLVALDEPAAGDGPLEDTEQLISNNLAAFLSRHTVAEGEKANARLSGTAHRIDGDLYQYWLTVTPQASDDELVALSASAYVTLPSRAAVVTNAARVPQPAVSVPRNNGDATLSPLRIVRADRYQGCERCSVLRADANADAVVFFLQYQPNYGLVRLADRACRNRTTARIVRAESPVEFAIPYHLRSRTDVREAVEWRVAPTADTYYAIAVSDERVARRLATHLDELPVRCTEAVRIGLRGAALQRWLDVFETIAMRAVPHVDWRAIEVRNVL